MNEETKVTVTADMIGKLKEAADKGKIRKVEDLFQIHNDEQTTKELNAAWSKLRGEVDGRASLDETKVKGELTIKIRYEADSDTGKKDIEILHDLKLPAPRSNKRTMYETAEGHLVDRKPSKQTEMFDNVKPIRKGV